MYQKVLFNLEEIFKEPLKKYEMFFSLPDFSCLEPLKHLGRKPVSRATLMRALIFKNLRSLPTLSDLVAELDERPGLSFILGLKPRKSMLPVGRFPSSKKKVEFFWGYRNPMINDAVSELPWVEITLPANVRGTSVVLSQFCFVKEPNKIRFVESFLTNFYFVKP